MMQGSEQGKLANIGHPMRVLASALFWGWNLVWASNAANAAWPARAPEMFAPVRLAWIGGMAVFVLFALRPKVVEKLNRRRLFQLSAPVTSIATLAVILIQGTAPLQIVLLTLATFIAGWGAGGLLPIWTTAFDTEDVTRLNLMIMTSVSSAVAVFHVVMLLPPTLGQIVFVGLPFASGMASLLDPIDKRPAPALFRPASESVYRFVDLGYVVVAIVAGFIFGLDVLVYEPTPRPESAFGLLIVGAAVAIALSISLYSLGRRSKAFSGYHAILPLLVMGVLSLPYILSGTETLIQIAVASSYVCWFLVFTLTHSDTVHHIPIGRWTITFSARRAGSFGSLLALMLGFALSRSTHMGDDIISAVFVGMIYTVVISTTLLISTRVAIFAGARESEGPVPVCDACTTMADSYGLTPRETEILEILAAGRSQTYIQNTLMIAKGTATTHISHIYQKLGIHSREELLDLVDECRTNGNA